SSPSREPDLVDFPQGLCRGSALVKEDRRCSPHDGGLHVSRDHPRPSQDRPVQLGHAGVEYHDAASILTRATGFMSSYDFTLNPYSGCSFGCTYCYAAFFARDPSRHDSWGRWVSVKQNAIEKL